MSLSSHAEVPETPTLRGLVSPSDLAAVAAILFGAVVVWLLILPNVFGDHSGSFTDDCNAYILLYQHPGEYIGGRWSFHVGHVMLARLLPFGMVTSFFVLTVGTKLISCGLLFLFLRLLGVGRVSSLCGIAVYTLSFQTRAYIQHIYMSDPLAEVFMLLGMIAIVMRWRAALAIIIALCVPVRENIYYLLFPFVLHSVFVVRWGWAKTLGAALLMSLPGIAVMWAWHALLYYPEHGGWLGPLNEVKDHSFRIPDTSLLSMDVVLRLAQRFHLSEQTVNLLLQPITLAGAFYRSWAMLWGCLAVYLSPALRRRAGWTAGILIPIFLSLPMGLAWTRYLAYAFLTMIPAIALWLDASESRGVLLRRLGVVALFFLMTTWKPGGIKKIDLVLLPVAVVMGVWIAVKILRGPLFVQRRAQETAAPAA
jgi:hypothetical protein